MARKSSWSPSSRELERRATKARISKRQISIAAISSIIVIGALLIATITSPGWEVVKNLFDVDYGKEVLPTVIKGLWLNLKLTVIGSICIGIIALSLAILRTTKSAALTPFRFLAAAYTDIFRGVPLLLVILLVGFGVPALQLRAITSNVTILGSIAVILTYSAYVSEVIRSGILSIHPSQKAAARSLGLSSAQTMRFVVLPQALRRVIPRY